MSAKAAAGLQIDPRTPILCTDFDPEPPVPAPWRPPEQPRSTAGGAELR
jgi:hypothetical protein